MVPFHAHAASDHVFFSVLLYVTTILAGGNTARCICHFTNYPLPGKGQSLPEKPWMRFITQRQNVKRRSQAER